MSSCEIFQKKNEKCSIRKINTELSNFSRDYLKPDNWIYQIDEYVKLRDFPEEKRKMAMKRATRFVSYELQTDGITLLLPPTILTRYKMISGERKR